MRIVGKKTEIKTNISLFLANIHTYKLTFFFYFAPFPKAKSLCLHLCQVMSHSDEMSQRWKVSKCLCQKLDSKTRMFRQTYLLDVYSANPRKGKKNFTETDNPVLLQNIYFQNLYRHKIVSVYLVMISQQFPFIYYYYWEMSFWKKFSSA